MSKLLVSAVDYANKAEGTVPVPERIVAEEAAGIWIGGPLYRLAEHIRGILGRLLQSWVYDSEPIERLDPDYSGCWPCCCCL
jgi:hypothetical protein